MEIELNKILLNSQDRNMKERIIILRGDKMIFLIIIVILIFAILKDI